MEDLRDRCRSANDIIRQSLLQKSNDVNAVSLKSLTAVETNAVVRQWFSVSSVDQGVGMTRVLGDSLMVLAVSTN